MLSLVIITLLLAFASGNPCSTYYYLLYHQSKPWVFLEHCSKTAYKYVTHRFGHSLILQWYYCQVCTNVQVVSSFWYCWFYNFALAHFILKSSSSSLSCWSTRQRYLILAWFAKSLKITVIFFNTIFQILMDPTMSYSCHSIRTSFALWRRRRETLIPVFTWRSDSPTVITRPKSKTTSTNSKTICTTTFKGIAAFVNSSSLLVFGHVYFPVFVFFLILYY